LLNIVQKSNIYGFDGDMALHSPWRRAVCGIGRIDIVLIGIVRIGIACIVSEISVSNVVFLFHFLGSFFKVCHGKLSWFQRQLQLSEEQTTPQSNQKLKNAL
jgi:hypothetical protein